MAAIQDLADRVKPTIYIDTDTGVDEELAGSESKPYKSLAFAFIQEGEDNIFKSRASKTGLADADPAERLAWKEPAKSAVKKAQSAMTAHKKKLLKQQEQAGKEQEKEKERLKTLEDAKKIVITEDASLPKATRARISDKTLKFGTRVKVSGHIHQLREQKTSTFVTLTGDGQYLQCIISAGDLTKTYDALTFAQGTALTLYGELKKVPEGATAPDGRELHVDYYKVHGASPSGADAITNRVSRQQDPWESEVLDQRHIALRGESASAVIQIRSDIEIALINIYDQIGFTKVSPPAFVQTQVEGGSTLFKLDYYGEEAYLTQSSQLYLETVIPSLGDVFCIEKSFRAEKSLTRRHLSEYSHVEAELDFIDFGDLLDHLEFIIMELIKTLKAKPATWGLIQKLNPGFDAPATPFKRMRYSDAIDWLNAQDPPILNEDFDPPQPHKFGDDIAEAAERRMTDILNVPILLTHFPVAIKAFYMKKDEADPRVTESVDVLMPGVGEIVGGSMRMEGYTELMEAYKREGIDPKEYYWYTDQRK